MFWSFLIKQEKWEQFYRLERGAEREESLYSIYQFYKSLTERWFLILYVTRGALCWALLQVSDLQTVVRLQGGPWSARRPAQCCKSHRSCISCPTRGRRQCSEPGSHCIWSVNIETHTYTKCISLYQRKKRNLINY